MKKLTKFGVFLVLLCLLSAGAALLFWDLGAECVSVLRTGVGSGGYLLTASDAEGRVYALQRQRGVYRLVIGDQAGRRTERWTLAKDVIPKESKPTVLYPASGGAVYLGLYSTEGQDTRLQLYRISDGGDTAEMLMNEPCLGDSLPGQMAGMRLSDFSEVDGVVTFALLRGDTAEFFQRTSAESGLERVRTVEQSDLRCALALSDGTLALVTGRQLIRTDRPPVSLGAGENVIQISQAGTGVYYVDGAGLRVFFADFAEWRPYAYLSLSKDAYDLDNATDLSLTRDGDALLLMNGQRLLLDRGSTVSDLSAMLYRSPVQCVLILAAIALGVLLLTFSLWYIVCEQRKLRLPLLVRWGTVAVAAAVLAVGGILRLAVEPAYHTAAQREAASLLGSVSALVAGNQFTDPQLPELLSDSVASAQGGRYWDTAVEVYFRDGEGIWNLVSGNAGRQVGIRAELTPSFDRVRAEDTLNSGSGAAFWTYTGGGEPHYVLYRAQGSYLLSADVGGERLLEAGRSNYSWMVRGLWALAILLAAVTLALLCWITTGLHLVLEGMERLAAGDRDVEVHLGGGDELESLADDVNALSHTMWELEERRSALAKSYRRFVPEKVLSLLGKEDIAEVDQRTFVSRHLAAMMLTFRFPDEVYSSSGKVLFDNVNEVIERTASIVSGKGGTVFNFAYNGYDAVFEGGSTAAVSTAVAVQQEVIELNREREAAGRPPVTVHIALDEGEVMLGVVGDGNQLDPASISNSFSIARHLTHLCDRLEANILCTEAVIGGIEGYASRYVGKCVESGETVRTYEIFDGDPYEVRKVKEQSCASFSEGIYALYSRDFSRAKSIFLQLVHRSTEDGGVRYYLYLADQLEKRPDQDIGLDAVI